MPAKNVMPSKNVMLVIAALLGVGLIFDLKRIGNRFYMSKEQNARVNVENALKRGLLTPEAAAAYVEAINEKRVDFDSLNAGLMGLE